MHSSTYIAALVAALPFASAVGQARVNNFCPQQICVYDNGNEIAIPAGTNHVYPYPANGMTGAQLQVSPTCDPNNVVYWEFAQGNNIIYYDVNTNEPQDPFSKRGLGVVGVNTSACPAISCAAGGSLACFNNPNGHQQNQVKACASSNSIDFNACRP